MREGLVLLADHDAARADALRGPLEAAGFTVHHAPSLEAALLGLRAATHAPKLLLSAAALARPGEEGLLAEAQRLDPDLPVWVYDAGEGAARALEAGAWEASAASPPPPLPLRVRRAMRQARVAREHRELRARLGASAAPSPSGLVGASPAMERLRAMIDRVGPTDLGVLITGESGTGKEVVARALHEASLRHERPFVPVDCASIPANLMESELFGHERGAFTGASGARRGLVEASHTGTFFLDEIGELGLPVQTRLLRLLQERQLRRVGGNRTIDVDIRVVAATNRPVEDMVRAGAFREDLFHRLNVVRLHLPPLRDRPEDIEPLLRHFLDRFGAELGRGALRFEPGLLEALCAWPWPGNVRELVNCARYLASLAPGPVLRLADLPQRLREDLGAGPLPPPEAPSAPGAPLAQAAIRYDLPYKQAKRRWLDVFEYAYITWLLRAHDGNVSHAARAAGIDRKSIQRLMRRGPLKADAPASGSPTSPGVVSSPPQK